MLVRISAFAGALVFAASAAWVLVNRRADLFFHATISVTLSMSLLHIALRKGAAKDRQPAEQVPAGEQHLPG